MTPYSYLFGFCAFLKCKKIGIANCNSNFSNPETKSDFNHRANHQAMSLVQSNAIFCQSVTNGHSNSWNYRTLCSPMFSFNRPLPTCCHFVQGTKAKKAADMTRQPATCDRAASAHVMAAAPTSCPAGDMQGERRVHLTLCLCPVTAH